MKSAYLVLKKNGEVFLYSSSLTKGNLWIVSEPYLRFNWPQLTIEDKFKHINEVLSKSKTGIERPTSYMDVGKELLSSYGFTKWNQLFKNAKLCFMEMADGNYIFTPSVYYARNSGHEAIKDGMESISIESNPNEIISSLGKVLEKCM